MLESEPQTESGQTPNIGNEAPNAGAPDSEKAEAAGGDNSPEAAPAPAPGRKRKAKLSEQLGLKIEGVDDFKIGPDVNSVAFKADPKEKDPARRTSKTREASKRSAMMVVDVTDALVGMVGDKMFERMKGPKPAYQTMYMTAKEKTKLGIALARIFDYHNKGKMNPYVGLFFAIFMIYGGRLFNNVLADKVFKGKKVADTPGAVKEIAQKVSPPPAEIKAQEKQDVAEESRLAKLEKAFEKMQKENEKLQLKNSELVKNNQSLASRIGLEARRKKLLIRKNPEINDSDDSDNSNDIAIGAKNIATIPTNGQSKRKAAPVPA